MCGISGYRFLEARPDAAGEGLRASIASLAHRGPDDRGLWEEGGAGLGHARLAILDLSPLGHQPMLSADGHWAMVFNGEDQRRALAVVSANSGDGKTFFTANLAVVLAQLGGRTLCMDADMRGPRLHEVFGVSGTAGLSGLLSGRAESNVIVQVPDLPSLFLLPVGITPPNPQELVERPSFGILMRELLLKFDHVVIDTPAAEFGADSSVIAAKAGAALVIARRGLTRMGALQDLVANLSDTPAKLAGVIMNEY